VYFQKDDGTLTREKPFAWPTNSKKDFGVIWRAPGA
jgi:hypothetical protein